MSLDSVLRGATSGNGAEVDEANNLKVNLPTTYDQSGYVRVLSEVDSGLSDGSPFLLQPETSEDFRWRSELDTLLDSHSFCETAQVTAKHTYRNTTMTATWPGGALRSNGSSVTSFNSGVLFNTTQPFPIYGGAQTYVYLKLRWNGTWAVTNTTIDTGLGLNPTSIPFAPTDGVYIRVNSYGIQGVMNYNGTETLSEVFKNSSGTTFVPTMGTAYDFIITVGENAAVFWLDDRAGNGPVMAARMPTGASNGRPCMSSSLPFFMRHAIGGTAASAVLQQDLLAYHVVQGGFHTSRPWELQAAMMGGSHQGLQGMTQGGLELLANNQALGAGAAMSNSAANLGTGLGGVFTTLPTLTAGTFGILSNYLVPAQTVTLPGRQLAIKGVKISAIVSNTLTGGPVVYLYSLAYGHTALSLATTESATNKKPRFIPLGQHAFAAAAAAGTTGGADVYMPFNAPIVVNPGEYVATVANNVGTVTTLGTITFSVTFDYCWL